MLNQHVALAARAPLISEEPFYQSLEQLGWNEQTNGTGLAGRPRDQAKPFEPLHHLVDGRW